MIELILELRDKMDLKKIEEKVLSYSRFVKEIAVVIYKEHPFAFIYPDFEALKEAKIINIKEEIRWYAVELYNMNAPEPQKIKGFKIFKGTTISLLCTVLNSSLS
jgi:long-chain acyl-CoA synthetase